MLIINNAKYLSFGITFSSSSPNQHLKPDLSHPSARAKEPPTKNIIVHGKCFSIIFQVNIGSYFSLKDNFFFGQAQIITSINTPDVVSLANLDKIQLNIGKKTNH